jgi:hypothetical protein
MVNDKTEEQIRDHSDDPIAASQCQWYSAHYPSVMRSLPAEEVSHFDGCPVSPPDLDKSTSGKDLPDNRDERRIYKAIFPGQANNPVPDNYGIYRGECASDCGRTINMGGFHTHGWEIRS